MVESEETQKNEQKESNFTYRIDVVEKRVTRALSNVGKLNLKNKLKTVTKKEEIKYILTLIDQMSEQGILKPEKVKLGFTQADKFKALGVLGKIVLNSKLEKGLQ